MDEIIEYMKEVMLVLGVADAFEEADMSGLVVQGGTDLMDTVPDYVRSIGLDWDSEVSALDSKPYEAMIKKYDALLQGKTTVKELCEKFGKDVGYLLVMQSVGHGVGLSDNRDLTKHLKSLGLDKDRIHVYADSIADYAGDHAYGILEAAKKHEADAGGEEQTESAKAPNDLKIAESALLSHKALKG